MPLQSYTSLEQKNDFIQGGSTCIDTKKELEALIKICTQTPELIFSQKKETSNLSKKEEIIQNGSTTTIGISPEIEAVLKACEPNTKLIFRGVNEASYCLYTSAQRAYNELKLNIPYSDFIQFYIDATLKSQEICAYFKEKEYQITDFLILSLLQHYGYPTLLLDFSYDIYSALFFAIDNMKDGNNDKISEYVSIYIVNSADDRVFPDIFQVNHNDGETIQWLQAMENDHIPEPAPETKQGFERIPLNNYIDIPMLLVSGGEDSATGVRIPIANFEVNYYNDNPRMNSQHGLFVYNSSSENSLERMIYEQTGCQQRKDYIHCYNIHKSLKDVITQCLKDNGISRETMYPNLEESTQLQKWLKECQMPSMEDIRENTESAREYLLKNILRTKEIVLTLRDFANSDDCPNDFPISREEGEQNEITIHIKDESGNLCFELSAVKMSISDRDDNANNCGWFIKTFQYYPYLLDTDKYEEACAEFLSCVKKQSFPQSNGNEGSHICDLYVWARFASSEKNPKIVNKLGLTPITKNPNEADIIYTKKISQQQN